MFYNTFKPEEFIVGEKLVFLGGTCNDTSWRDELIPQLKINYFNPVVKDWTPEAQEEEIECRQKADYALYVLTPAMTGVYSIAEVVDDSNKRPSKTIFCYLPTDKIKGRSYSFDKGQIKSLDKIGEMVETNGGKWFKTLSDVAAYLNRQTDVTEKTSH